MDRLLLVMCALAVLVSAPAQAATRTVCFNMTFKENRDVLNVNSPLEGEAGAIRGRHVQGGNTRAVGHLYELWDKDDPAIGYDDFIGKFIKTFDGRACASFDWVASQNEGEADPDVYVRYVNEVRDTALVGDKVKAFDENRVAYSKIVWRNHVAQDCQAGATCDITAPGTALAITSTTSGTRAERVNALDTAQRALQSFAGAFDGSSTGTIEMNFPCVNFATVTGVCLADGMGLSRDRFTVNNTAGATNGRTPAHELGHLLQKNGMGLTSVPFDPSMGGGDRAAPKHESHATVEGWADFVAAASWWSTSNLDSLPVIAGYGMESTNLVDPSSCAANSGIQVQVTRGFWDLADVKNEVGVPPATQADTFQTTLLNLAEGWQQFANGTANRQRREEVGFNGVNDPDGGNLRDYFVNNKGLPGFGTGFFTTLLGHNCTNGQDDG